MAEGKIDIQDFHWLMTMLQAVDVGIVLIDQDFKIQAWNSFMENHSGRKPDGVLNRNIFEIFGDINESWLRRKIESVFLLRNRAFTTWEQRPYLFRFKNYRPITGSADFMYQNITFMPLLAADGEVHHVGIIIYDVTDMAVNKMELEESNKQLESLSRTDRLTRLHNRGYWEECLINEYNRSHRTKYDCSLIMFDIDHFKKVNDTYGHQAGDEVIRRTAAALRETIRGTDIAGRYGGEEFAVILVDTDPEAARLVAERLRKKIEAQPVLHDNQSIAYTISLGVAGFDPGLVNHTQWIERADQALYQAKHGGRNQSVIFSA
jgi:diguanylate cyclase (GGDEF)-like protein/PAS domain S-box-containing protein